MWIDTSLEFCDNFTTLAAGDTKLESNIVDLGTADRDIGNGQPMYLVIKVTTAYSGGTSNQFILASDDVEAIATNGDATEHYRSDVFTNAQLTAGFSLCVPLPMGDTANQGEDIAGYERYLGILCTDVGTSSTGAIDAFLTNDPVGWVSYPDGNNTD